LSRILTICLLLLIVIWWRWDCLIFGTTGTPSFIVEKSRELETETAVFLFGNICSVCPSGDILESLRDQNILFVFDGATRSGEIQRFMETFQMEGIPIIDDGTVQTFLERRAACGGNPGWRHNYYVILNQDNHIQSLERF